MKARRLGIQIAALVCGCVVAMMGCGSAVDSQAEDAACTSLLRDAMVAVEVAYVDLGTYDLAVMTPGVLSQINPVVISVTVPFSLSHQRPPDDRVPEHVLPLPSEAASVDAGCCATLPSRTTPATRMVTAIQPTRQRRIPQYDLVFLMM